MGWIPRRDDLILTKLEQVCYGCPSSWEGLTASGQRVHIRYRYGWLQVESNGELIFEEPSGDSWCGIMSTEEMLQLTKYEVNE